MDEGVQEYRDAVQKLMVRLGRAMEKGTGTSFSASEVQTLSLTSLGEDAATCLHGIDDKDYEF